MTGANDERQRILEQELLNDIRGGQLAHRTDQHIRASLPQGLQHALVRSVENRDTVLGMMCAEPQHHLGNDAAAGQRHRPDRRRSPLRTPERRDFGPRLTELADGELHLSGEAERFARGPHTVARHLEERHAEGTLELLRGPMKCRPSGAGGARGRTESARLHHEK